ncbi:sensor histidine kinase [Nonomuraea muscovyensis]|uniref:histidine kinase n=1 Tax=Nonomuraea muscovyensis TaxID=1124761 RepID=A0A7X0C8W0_9ACTN|nr:nitrate- and nitrite sensing domain-containing protein [Nonomuraea muscovyensis]MBB6348839.1 signal transduction histidine kinase [Nonomuraea muscovyensis]
MRPRNSRLRTKITALLLSLTALWAFAAWVTLRDGVNLLWVQQVDGHVISPSETVLVELQRERRTTMVRLGDSSPRSRKLMQDQRKRSDQVKAAFEESTRAWIVDWAVDDEGDERLAQVFKRLDGLRAVRTSIDAGQMTRLQASKAYADVIDSIYSMYGAMATVDDKTVAQDVRTLLQLSRAQEVLSREDSLLAGALAEGRLTVEEHKRFAETVGAWRILAEHAAAELPHEDQVAYNSLMQGGAFTRLTNLETLLADFGGDLEGIPFGAEQWKAATERASAELNAFVFDAGDRVVERVEPVAVGVVVRLVLMGGLGLLAVIASIVLSITTTRRLLAQLQKLRDAAHELSDERLPGVVERIGRGETVDVAVEAPALQFGDDEIGQVGQAFNTVQETAIRVAVEQAALRRSIRDILLSLARRTQGLVHRQLTVLDVMERRETDPEELKELFRLDHLAIRMRRNAENLIVLSGSSPARTWRRSVPMVDVVRGALAEVEDYTRVDLMPMGDVVLVGRAVGDVIHLLAEVIENAVSFSPPYTTVQVSGQLVANGYVIEVEDRGLGMKPEDLAAANERIADPPEFRITGTARLGLYVVSRLAERHGIHVVLKQSPYGGTTVVVLLPQELVEIDDSRPDPDDRPPARLPQRQSSATNAGPSTGLSAVATAARPAAAENVRSLRVASARRALALRSEELDGPREPADAHDRTAPHLPAELRQPTEAREPAEAREPGERGGSEAAPEERATPERRQAPTEFTPSGLPFRVPQANLNPALRAEPPDVSTVDEEDDDERSPEEIRAMMGSLQSGTRLGRSEAAKLMDDQRPGGDG